MINVLVLMSAIVPTTGHRDLIDFATNIPGNPHVRVLLSARSFEPLPAGLRYQALAESILNPESVTFCLSLKDEAPQNPEDMPSGFWEWWRDEINNVFPEVEHWDYVVASETYGFNVASSLGAKFLPFDVARSINDTQGRRVRENILSGWDSILPVVRNHLKITATFFGQESVGKTTVSRMVADRIGNSLWLPEYARPYLTLANPEVTQESMHHIYLGQTALQENARNNSDHPFVCQDTDLFSTVGYWKIMGETPPGELVSAARRLASDVYYILPDDIPLEKDILRYGGDVRESAMGFWEDILNSISTTPSYVVVPNGLTLEEKVDFIMKDLYTRFHAATKPIRDFIRD